MPDTTSQNMSSESQNGTDLPDENPSDESFESQLHDLQQDKQQLETDLATALADRDTALRRSEELAEQLEFLQSSGESHRLLRESEAKWRVQLGEQEAEREQLIADLNAVTQQNEHLRAQMGQRETVVIQRVSQLQNVHNQLREKVLSEREEFQQQLEAVGGQLSELQDQVDQRDAAIEQHLSAVVEAHAQVERMTIDLHESNSRIVTASDSEEHLRSELAELRGVLQAERQQLQDSAEELAKLRDQSDQQIVLIQQHADSLNEARDAEERLNNELNYLRGASEAKEKTSADLVATQNRLQETVSKLNVAQNRSVQLQSVIDQQVAAANESERERNQLKAELESVQNASRVAQREHQEVQKLLAAFQVQVEKEGQKANDQRLSLESEIERLNQQLVETNAAKTEDVIDSAEHNQLRLELERANEKFQYEKSKAKASSEKFAQLAVEHESAMAEIAQLKQRITDQANEAKAVDESSVSPSKPATEVVRRTKKTTKAKRPTKSTKKSTSKAKPKAAKKKTSVRKTPASKSSTKSTRKPKDDLTRIDGIGPKVRDLLISKRITTFNKLATTSAERLAKILESGGPSLKGRDTSTWAQQAKLASEAKWTQLTALQALLSAKKRK